MSLTAEQIDQATDIRIEKISVPEWGGHVYLRTLSARQVIEWQQSIDDDKAKKASFRERLVAMAICNEGGIPLYADLVDGADRLGKRNNTVLHRVFTKAVEVNRINDMSVEDVAGNSDATQSDSSPSD